MKDQIEYWDILNGPIKKAKFKCSNGISNVIRDKQSICRSCKGIHLHDSKYSRQLTVNCANYTKSQIWNKDDVSDF